MNVHVLESYQNCLLVELKSSTNEMQATQLVLRQAFFVSVNSVAMHFLSKTLDPEMIVFADSL